MDCDDQVVRFPGPAYSACKIHAVLIKTRNARSIAPTTRILLCFHASDSCAAGCRFAKSVSACAEAHWRSFARFTGRTAYVFLRCQAIPEQRPQDLTEAFFAELIESRSLCWRRSYQGAVSLFLLGTLKYFVAHARDRDRAQNAAAVTCRCNWMRRRVRKPKLTPRDPTVKAQMCIRTGMGGITCSTSALSAFTGYELGGKGALFEALKSRWTGGEAAAIPDEELANRLGRTADICALT